MASARDAPPPHNPFLSAYENFHENTPFLTRIMLSVQVVSYCVSWIIDPQYALANIPHFVIFQFEIYRIVLSPLVNTQLFSLLFAFLSFLELGKRLEYNLGTVAFAWLCAGVALIANIGFLILAILLYAISGEQGYLMTSASGIWLILFGVIAAECIQAPADIKRRFFFCEVPVRYYPLALFVFFAFLSGAPSVAYAISMGVGYLYGQGRLGHLLTLSNRKVSEWENSVLSTLTSKKGWVYGHAALGSDVWDQIPVNGITLPVSSFQPRPQASNVEAPSHSSFSAGSVIAHANRNSSNSNSFSGSQGHTLGSSTSRRTADIRASRLAALDGNNV